MKVKLLLAVDRRKLESLEETVELLKKLKMNPEYESLVVGLDISGDPRVGDLMSVISRLKEIQSEGIKLAILLAEVFNPEETKSFLQFQPDRIGHGTCIHPSLGGSQDLWDQLLQFK